MSLRRRNSLAALAASICLALLNGCSRGVATTTVNANGSWTRQVTFRQSKMEGAPTETALKDSFVFPQGAGWKSVPIKAEKGEEALSFQREMQVGDSLKGDISVRNSKKKLTVCVNTVVVKRIEPGKYSYTETFHWTGEMPKELTQVTPEQIGQIRAYLPPELAKEADAKDIAQRLTKEMYIAMMGPPDPLINHLLQILSSPEAIEKLLKKRVSAACYKVLEEKFGSKLSPEKRKRIVQNWIKLTVSKTAGSAQDKTNGKEGEDSGPGASLFCSVRFPGKIIETNGEIDEAENEAYWSFYPEGAAAGDFTLKATCSTK